LFLDPDQLLEASPAEVLDAAARGHLGLDHRFLHAFIDRPEEAIPAVVDFGERDRGDDMVDLASELIALFRFWKTPDGVPFLVKYIAEDPENVPDEVVVSLVEAPEVALEPLLELYGQLEETESGEVAFILANLRIRDERILQVLLDRLEYDLSDTLLLLGIYGDPAAIEAVRNVTGSLDEAEVDLRKEAANVLESLGENTPRPQPEYEPFDIWELYPEIEDLPVDILPEDERLELLLHPVDSVRAAAAHTFFNQPLEPEQRVQLLAMAQTDESVEVRARAWESLIDATDNSDVVEAMLEALRDPSLSIEEQGGLIVGLAPETDRNEVREAMIALYNIPEGRAKAMEAMWRSVYPGFRDYFAPHLDDPDLETRRAAIWGVGYFGLKSELDKIRDLFADEELRSDALFAYALAIPADISRGRMTGLLARIEKDAQGLSEMEEELVKAALDERLMLAGKEPAFRSIQEED
jgi:HEAT repeat protein